MTEPHLSAPEPELDVLVLGGGIAGLVAARDIGEQGLSVAVLEARERLGGRTWSRRMTGHDLVVELGGSWINRELQPEVAREVARYDLAVRKSEPFSGAVWAGIEDRIEGVSALEVFDELYSPAQAAIDADVAAIREAYAVDGALPAELDVAADIWIDALDVPRATKEALLAWLAALGGGDPARQSILILTADLALSGFGVEHSLEMIAETFADGTGSLVAAIAGEVGGEIVTGAVVARVEHGGGRVQVTMADGGVRAARAAVVALPLNCLENVVFDPPLHPFKRAAFAERHPGTATKVVTITRGFGAWSLGWAWGHPLQAAVGMYPVERGTLVTGFDGVGALGDPNDPQAVQAALRVFAPDAEVIAAESHDWVTDPFAQGAWLSWPPGWAAGVGEELARQEGLLHFAGSDVAIEGGSYIEGAIGSGRAAAVAVAATLALA